MSVYLKFTSLVRTALFWQDFTKQVPFGAHMLASFYKLIVRLAVRALDEEFALIFTGLSKSGAKFPETYLYSMITKVELVQIILYCKLTPAGDYYRRNEKGIPVSSWCSG